jgi:hypothetical protein
MRNGGKIYLGLLLSTAALYFTLLGCENPLQEQAPQTTPVEETDSDGNKSSEGKTEGEVKNRLTAPTKKKARREMPIVKLKTLMIAVIKTNRPGIQKMMLMKIPIPRRTRRRLPVRSLIFLKLNYVKVPQSRKKSSAHLVT